MQKFNPAFSGSDVKKYILKKNLKKDLPASIVVFLVALPLCLGIALASGAPLFAGLITGIIGGVVVASFSGSQLSVSGPAAGFNRYCFGCHNIFGELSNLFTCSCTGWGIPNDFRPGKSRNYW
jgi:MFS superfamily sulfate permease-like transporter